ncbi:hypothetical protein ACFL21_04810 [Patescibacteria group bacterium]
MSSPTKPRDPNKKDFSPRSFWLNRTLDGNRPAFNLLADKEKLTQATKTPIVNFWGLNHNQIESILQHDDTVEFSGNLPGKNIQEILSVLVTVRKNLNSITKLEGQNPSQEKICWNYKVTNWPEIEQFEVDSPTLDDLIEKTRKKLSNFTNGHDEEL